MEEPGGFHGSSARQEACPRAARWWKEWPRGLRGCSENYINQKRISTLAERNRKPERFHGKKQHRHLWVCAFQPSPAHSNSTHTYISGDKEKHEKKLIIFLCISTFFVLPFIQHMPPGIYYKTLNDYYTKKFGISLLETILISTSPSYSIIFTSLL